MIRRFVQSLAPLVLLAGCQLSLEGKHRCESDSDCLRGRICEMATCVAPGSEPAPSDPDGGRDDDGGSVPEDIDADSDDTDADSDDTDADSDDTDAAIEDGGAEGLSDAELDAPATDAQGGGDQDASSDADVASGDASDAASDGGGGSDGGSDGGENPPPNVASYLCGGPDPTASVLMTVGVGSGIVRISSDRALAQQGGTWTLWDLMARRQVAQGKGGINNRPFSPTGAADLVGGHFVVSKDDQNVELRSSSDGGLVATIAMDPVVHDWTDGSEPELSWNGSYLWQKSAASLQAWSLSGALLFRRLGNYADAYVFAATSELRVAVGPAGSKVIESVSLDGTSMVSPMFTGSFYGWFADGERFFSSDGAALRIYSRAAVSQQLVQGTSRIPWGYGDLFVADGGIYRVGTATPLATFDLANVTEVRDTATTASSSALFRHASNAKAYALNGQDAGRMMIVDLASGTPSIRTETIATDETSFFSPGPDGTWALLSGGRLYWYRDQAHEISAMGCGDVTALVGSRSGRVAVATSDGLVRIFSLGSTAPQFEGGIQERTSDLAISGDGAYLASMSSAGRLRVYSLPGGALVHEWPTAYSATSRWWSLARDGQRLAYRLCGGYPVTCRVQVSNLDGIVDSSASITLSGTSSNETSPLPNVAISPGGTRVAVWAAGSSGTSIYENGVFVGASSALVVGWIDDERLVVMNGQNNTSIVTNVQGEPQHGIASTVRAMQSIDSTQFYDALTDTIFASSDGHVLWAGGSTGVFGAIAGQYRVRSDRWGPIGLTVWP